jgi:E3 ubiquitin-protein ligase HECTD2
VRHCLHSFITRRLRTQSSGEALSNPGIVLNKVSSVESLDKTICPSLGLGKNTRSPGPPPDGPRTDATTFATDGGHLIVVPTSRNKATARSYSSSYPERKLVHGVISDASEGQHRMVPSRDAAEEARRIFKPLDDYITNCFASFQCINGSFLTHRPNISTNRTGSESLHHRPPVPQNPSRKEPIASESTILDLDPRLLLLGDFAENGSWWTGGQEDVRPARSLSRRNEETISLVNQKSPQMDWRELTEWYNITTNAAQTWRSVYRELLEEKLVGPHPDTSLVALEASLIASQEHTQRVLLKATETLLKRPGRPLTNPSDLRFLLIILSNPLLHANSQPSRNPLGADSTATPLASPTSTSSVPFPKPKTGPISGQNSGIIKRILGLLANSSQECHTYLVAWFARYPQSRFLLTKDLFGGFLTYRLLRQGEKRRESKFDFTEGLIPNVTAGRSAASLHAALEPRASGKKASERSKDIVYRDDWQVRAASKSLALLFSANVLQAVRRGDAVFQGGHADGHGIGLKDGGIQQLLPTSEFYNTLIDHADLIADFEVWESRRGRFAFCQYPFLLSIWAKIQILEHEAKRQMQSKARDAFFDSILSRTNINQFLILDVRRDCLVDDSLRAVSEVIGSGGEDIKKGLRIIFRGEEGIDAGGLRKEWFLLLIREVFNPDHGRNHPHSSKSRRTCHVLISSRDVYI